MGSGDSGGAGKYRGGTGQIMEVTHANGKAFAINSMFDRVIHPPRGRNGGSEGWTGRLYLDSGKELKGKGRQTIPGDDKLIIEMPGGGGLEQPFLRPPALVGQDVLNGHVSVSAALSKYGVVVDKDGIVNTAKRC